MSVLSLKNMIIRLSLMGLLLSVNSCTRVSTEALLGIDYGDGRLKLVDFQVISNVKIRLGFSEDLFLEDARNPANYQVVNQETNQAVTTIGVSQPDQGNDKLIEILFAGFTEGDDYQFTARNVFSQAGSSLDSNIYTTTFVGPSAVSLTTELVIDVPAIIDTGSAFIIEVEARDRQTGELDYNFELPITAGLAASSEGSGDLDGPLLAVNTVEDWNLATTRIFATYNHNDLPVGDNEIVFLEVASEDGTFRSISDEIQAFSPIVLDHFTVDVPAIASVNDPFDVTITARDRFGNVFPDFNTPEDSEVYITSSTSSGIFIVDSPIDGFINGVRTVQSSYSIPAIGLNIRAQLGGDATISGESDSIQIQSPAQAALANFKVTALPVAVATLRLAWTAITESDEVIIWQETGTPDCSLVPSGAGEVRLAGTANHYYFNGLNHNTSYTWCVAVEDNTDTLLLEQAATATTLTSGGCSDGTILPTQTFNTVQNWTVAGSPYCITGDLTFDAGSRLNLERGTQVLLDGGVNMTFTNGAEFVPAETGSGMVYFTSASTDSPPAKFGSITMTSTASPTNFQIGTNDYLSGSVVRHMYFDYGGRINADQGSLKVQDIVFRQSNRVDLGDGIKFHVSDSTFQNNQTSSSQAGAGLAGNTETVVESSIFEYNSGTGTSAAGSAGALYGCKSLSNSYFIGNSNAAKGGAVRQCLTIENSVFVKNFSAGSGGAYAADIGGAQQFTKTVLYNNYFYQNEADGDGGAVYIPTRFSSATAFFSYNNWYEGNYAGGDGGALNNEEDDAGGQLYHNLKYDAFIDNSSAGSGGAVFLGDGSGSGAHYLYNMYFSGNQSATDSALYVRSNDSILRDSLMIKVALDVKPAANVTFTIDGLIDDSYFESGAVDCATAFVTGAENSCAAIKTDAPWPLCADVSPGLTDPVGCVGPNWSKPEL